MNKDGSSPTKIAPTEAEPFEIRLDDTHVYWTNNLASGDVRKVEKAGGTPATLASGEARPVGISIDADTVYWANDDGGTVRSVPKAGGSAKDLSTGQARPRSTWVEGNIVYYVTVDDGRVKRFQERSGNDLVQNERARVLASDATGTDLLFPASPLGGIYRVPKARSVRRPIRSSSSFPRLCT
jgi:hypothetical protein